MLGLAEDVAEGIFPNLDVWVVATGAEEAGTFGSAAFVQKYGQDFYDAYFINLDNVGAGTVQYMTGEGMFQPIRLATS